MVLIQAALLVRSQIGLEQSIRIISSSSGWRSESRRDGDGHVEDLCRWLLWRWGLHRGEATQSKLCWHFRDVLWSCLGCVHLNWIHCKGGTDALLKWHLGFYTV